MVNLIAGEQIVPELVQQDFTAEKIVAQIAEILPDGRSREKMLAGLIQVKGRLRTPEGRFESSSKKHPADRAAEIILALPRPSPESRSPEAGSR
jgi:lipid-A-disaccharide synthase